MALTYNTTNTYAWGTFVCTFTSGAANGNSFIVEDATFTQSTWLADRKDNVGNPNGALGGIEAASGRMTLQLANANVVAPQPFDEFTRSLRPGASANTFFLTEVGLPKKQRDFDTVEVTFREKI